MRKVLVFGQSGQVAQSFADITAAEFEIKCVGRPSADITNVDLIGSAVDAFEPDIVVNAAAYTAVDKAEDEQDLAFAVNRDGSRNLATVCQRVGVPLIHYSTDYVFDGTGERPWLETDQTSPLGVYGRSKLAGEQAIREVLDNHYILRTAWVYSPYGQNFVKTMLRLGAERDTLTVVDDQIGNPTYAPDIAVASVKLIDRAFSQTPEFGVYHLAGSGSASWFDFAKYIFEQAQHLSDIQCAVSPIPSSAYPTPAERPKNSRLDSTKLLDIHGVALPSWQNSVQACLKALLEGK